MVVDKFSLFKYLPKIIPWLTLLFFTSLVPIKFSPPHPHHTHSQSYQNIAWGQFTDLINIKLLIHVLDALHNHIMLFNRQRLSKPGDRARTYWPIYAHVVSFPLIRTGQFVTSGFTSLFQRIYLFSSAPPREQYPNDSGDRSSNSIPWSQINKLPTGNNYLHSAGGHLQ